MNSDAVCRYFNTSVTHILSTVVEALLANPSRRFIWSEIKVSRSLRTPLLCAQISNLPLAAMLRFDALICRPPQWLEMWWPSQSTATQAAFKKLVANGQLEFVGAGAVLCTPPLPPRDLILSRLEPNRRSVCLLP
jgi:hypothetical protein